MVIQSLPSFLRVLGNESGSRSSNTLALPTAADAGVADPGRGWGAVEIGPGGSAGAGCEAPSRLYSGPYDRGEVGASPPEAVNEEAVMGQHMISVASADVA